MAYAPLKKLESKRKELILRLSTYALVDIAIAFQVPRAHPKLWPECSNRDHVYAVFSFVRIRRLGAQYRQK